LISREWGQKFPLCSTSCLLWVGSDHAPIMLDSGEDRKIRRSHFHFEKQWLMEPDFKEVVINKIADIFLSHKYRSALDMWHMVMTQLRKFLKGYGANLRGDIRRRKAELGGLIAELDKKADTGQMRGEEWSQRYSLEEELAKIYR
jgi:hypothetical protein